MKSITKTFVTLAFAAPVFFSGAAFALDGEKLFQEKTCSTCHGKDGKTPILPIYPKIAGQNKDYALAQMKDVQSGARSNGQTAAMKGVMHLVNDEEMEALAAYLETLAP